MSRIEDDLPLRGPEGFSVPSAGGIRKMEKPYSGPSFKDSVSKFVAKVNELQLTAADNAERLAAGEQMNLHDVLIQQEQASLAFQLTLQMRNRIVEAYQEVMRTQI
jgi:flagellar hook-basal body complex protein FliE